MLTELLLVGGAAAGAYFLTTRKKSKKALVALPITSVPAKADISTGSGYEQKPIKQVTAPVAQPVKSPKDIAADIIKEVKAGLAAERAAAKLAAERVRKAAEAKARALEAKRREAEERALHAKGALAEAEAVARKRREAEVKARAAAQAAAEKKRQEVAARKAAAARKLREVQAKKEFQALVNACLKTPGQGMCPDVLRQVGKIQDAERRAASEKVLLGLRIGPNCVTPPHDPTKCIPSAVSKATHDLMAGWCLNQQGKPFSVNPTKKGQGKLSCDAGAKGMYDLMKIGQKYFAVRRPKATGGGGFTTGTIKHEEDGSGFTTGRIQSGGGVHSSGGGGFTTGRIAPENDATKNEAENMSNFFKAPTGGQIKLF